MAAAILLLCKSHATTIESSVFRLQRGVKPKKIPTANPSAIECGESSIAIRAMVMLPATTALSHRAATQRFSSGCASSASLIV